MLNTYPTWPLLFLAICSTWLPNEAMAQSLDRVPFQDQELWVNGSNVAWVNFARDVGPGPTNLPVFREMFRELHQAGGNSLRFWLHTTGATSPEFSGELVVGPGEDTIDDLLDILNAAWDQEIGLMLTLWGHDMLRTTIDPVLTARNKRLLTDPSALEAYISNALIPMVEAVGNHPALLAWEVFNEPEGISIEHGWSDRVKVPMADIQRVTNRIAGAIHRAVPEAKVTTGAHGMYANSDVTLNKGRNTEPTAAIPASLREHMISKYGALTESQMKERLFAGARAQSFNYYRDDRLVAAGGDVDGTLDFYTIHYYDWAQTAGSPFHKDYSDWQLDKPMIIAEFFMIDTFGVEWEDLYETLFRRGYAGAMSWQWYDTWARGNESWPRTLANTATMAALAPEAVDIVTPGPDIHFFTVTRREIEPGDSVTLSWRVSNAEQVLLNGTTVEAESSLEIFPEQSTTYTLQTSGEGITRSDSLNVAVLPPSEINRAMGQPSSASSGESGPNSDPSLAFDGNTASRWSSVYDDNQWIQVDLGRSVDVEHIELRWEVAFAKEYDILLSFDGKNWRTVHEERDGDGGIDAISLSQPSPGRFVRLSALTRGTAWGFSLWEMGIYGLISAEQPPIVAIVSPDEGGVYQVGDQVTIALDVSDDNDNISSVDVIMNGETVQSLSQVPYQFDWSAPAGGGEFELYAVARDSTGLSFQSSSVSIVVLGANLVSRYEMEATDLTGAFQIISEGGFSANPFVSITGSTSATLYPVTTLQAGSHDLGVRFRLTDQPVSAQIRVNGLPAGLIAFDAAPGVWDLATRSVQLRAGDNRIDLLLPKDIDLDYVEIAPPGLYVSVQDQPEIPCSDGPELFPNPVREYFELECVPLENQETTVSLIDIQGRILTTLYEGHWQGSHINRRFDLPELSSGLYFVRVHSKGVTKTVKMVVLR